MNVPANIKHFIVKPIERAGGRANLVGGAVIDTLLNREPKDWDIEVFGLSYSRLQEMFSEYSPDLVGKSFGVMKFTLPGGLEIDMSVPRIDNRVGVGHKGFEVESDPRMTPLEAARRRDFTINAMAIDLGSGDLLDPFNGKDDLYNGVLSVVDPELFVQDPLRGMRAVQILARKVSRVHDKTFALLSGMGAEVFDMPKERIWGELQKLMLSSERPSVGFKLMRDLGWLELYMPELHALIGCEQNEKWHPEGDVWTHTMQAVDAAASIREYLPEAQQEAFMWGCFLHDIGKPVRTITQKMIDSRDPRVAIAAEKADRAPQDMLLTAHGHDTAGVPLAHQFLSRLTNENSTLTLVPALVGLHMQGYNLLANKSGRRGYARLGRKIAAAGGDLHLLGRLCQCDSCASDLPGQRNFVQGEPDWDEAAATRILEYDGVFKEPSTSIEPKVLGRHLIRAGLKPGVHFKKLLDECLDVQDGNPELSTEEILFQATGLSL